jgi:hypothetical protein
LFDTFQLRSVVAPTGAKITLINAADSGTIFVSRGVGTVVAQYCGGAAGGLLRRCSGHHHGAALLYMGGIKFLFADVIWLFARKVAPEPMPRWRRASTSCKAPLKKSTSIAFSANARFKSLISFRSSRTGELAADRASPSGGIRFRQ